MNVIITEIPHEAQRYPTVGDWIPLFHEGLLQIYVSKFADWRYGFLIGVHEMLEASLCCHRLISEEVVTQFDTQFEREGREGEAGDDPKAPYHHEHVFATNVEKMLAKELGVDWEEYEKALDVVYIESKRKFAAAKSNS